MVGENEELLNNVSLGSLQLKDCRIAALKLLSV